MRNHNRPNKGSINPYMLLIASIVIILSLGLFVFAFLTHMLYSETFNTSSAISMLTAIISVLIISVLLLLGALLGKVRKEHLQINELKNFKDFVDTLHYVATEAEAYEVLRDFTAKMNFIDKAVLLYQSDSLNEPFKWKSISDEDILICDIFYSSCSILNSNDREYTFGNISKDSECPLQFKKYTKGSYACLLLNEPEHPQAILQLYSKKENSFNGITLAKVRSYIEIARPVIKAKRMLHILNRKASTDTLTKLYNRDFLDIYLENQIEASDLSGQQLSIIIVDIDFFKTINDSFGHAAGDYILTHFARLVLKCIRKSDIVARYGGDEFVVILPSTDIKTAETIGERIRHALANTFIPALDGVDIPSVTCSLGISTYPILCHSKENLIKTADTALYKAKRSGRNCTRVYEDMHSAQVPATGH